jgi:hypothetical protein
MGKKKKVDLRLNNFMIGIEPDFLIYEMFQKTDVQFIGSQAFKPFNGWEVATEEEMTELIIIVRKHDDKLLEFVVEGDEEAIEYLRALYEETDSALYGLDYDEAVKFLEQNGFTHEIVLEEEAHEI